MPWLAGWLAERSVTGGSAAVDMLGGGLCLRIRFNSRLCNFLAYS